MARALAVGGVFFKAKNPKALGAWYKKHLGLEVESWGGATFSFSASAVAVPKGFTVWSPFDQGTDYFSPKGKKSSQVFMINLVVDELDGLLKKLKRAKVKIDAKPIEESEFGRFAWVFDLEGNKVELWEPPG